LGQARRLGRDLLDRLVEVRVHDPARDLTQRVGAGNDVGAVVVAEEGGPAQGLGDGGAVAELVVGVPRGVAEWVLLREDVALAVVGFEPLENAGVGVPHLATGGYVVLGAGGTAKRIHGVGLAPVLVVLHEDIGVVAWVNDPLQQTVAGVVGKLPGGVGAAVAETQVHGDARCGPRQRGLVPGECARERGERFTAPVLARIKGGLLSGLSEGRHAQENQPSP